MTSWFEESGVNPHTILKLKVVSFSELNKPSCCYLLGYANMDLEFTVKYITEVDALHCLDESKLYINSYKLGGRDLMVDCPLGSEAFPIL